MRRLLLLVVVAACGRAAPLSESAWHDAAGYRWRSLDVRGGGRTGTAGFTLLEPARTGVTFTNTVSESSLVHNRQLAQGAGVCLADVDGDGRPDIFLARTEGPNALYRNLGNWKFEDITTQAGVAAPDRVSTGCAFADVDGDGDADLVLTSLGGPNAIFVNDGKGHFSEQRRGLTDVAGSMSIAVADVDGDGDLDLYIVNNKAYTALDRMAPSERAFNRVTRQLGPNRYEVLPAYRRDYKLVDRADLGGISLAQRADPDFVYLNDGTGHFVREPMARSPRFVDETGAPLREEREDFGLAAVFADLNGDGAPELYVANDFEDPDQLWMNDGHGRFRLAPWYALRSTSNSGMAVALGDVNRDGYPDLFEVDMLSLDTHRLKTQVPTHTAVAKLPGIGDDRPQMQRNTLQLNRGDGTFAELARFAGVGRSGWSWSATFLDVDLDGWEDLLIGTGHVWDVMDGDAQQRLRSRIGLIDWRHMLFEFPPLPLPNVAFRNRGDLTFEDASKTWHFDIGNDISHGMALADLDGDGDLDVVINRLDQPAAVLRNDATAPRISVRLRGTAPNTGGLGSRVVVRGGAVPMQSREMIGGGLYLSSSDASLTFATGSATHVKIEVEWRDGARSEIDSATPNREYEIAEPDTTHAARRTPHVVPTPIFEDASSELAGHQHVDPHFDDYARQPLLPNAFSQLGPGVAWEDADGDGREDLFVGTGRSGRLAYFHNANGQLRPSGVRFPPAPGDLTTLVGWPDGHGGRQLLAGVAAYEIATNREARATPSVVAYSPSTGVVTPMIDGDTASVGPLAVADYDGDGDLDLFVGARIFPAGYPLSPSSRLYRNDGGRFTLDSANTRVFAGLGMVSSAIFSDIDGDGDPDLLLAVEWGGIRVFRNDGGHFVAVTIPGLSEWYTRWNGLATGDLDGDGRLDIVATSWGRNTDYRVSPDNPLLLYVGFFAGGGRPDFLVAQNDPRIHGVAPLTSFDRLNSTLPAVAMRLGSYSAYADATIDQVLGPLAPTATRLGATTLDHMVFLNRGNRFDAHPLPDAAQLAPAFYVGIADFNGDGKEDLLLTQNFFQTDVETPRYDAGRSLLLLGDGAGALLPLSGQVSGLMVYGEQRGAAYADYDGDGRLDIAVSENGAPTKLFHNIGATPGLGVHIAGPPGNPSGIGAQLRLRYGDRAGPVREIQAGSGYWSQN
ncbi:MAG TPA: VCBS repeat-containing protein, partial [Gemmatimonadales bacterium]|nr:VCBS repeat-containing protein [Gemmatimonadales bacterium]